MTNRSVKLNVFRTWLKVFFILLSTLLMTTLTVVLLKIVPSVGFVCAVLNLFVWVKVNSLLRQDHHSSAESNGGSYQDTAARVIELPK